MPYLPSSDNIFFVPDFKSPMNWFEVVKMHLYLFINFKMPCNSRCYWSFLSFRKCTFLNAQMSYSYFSKVSSIGLTRSCMFSFYRPIHVLLSRFSLDFILILSKLYPDKIRIKSGLKDMDVTYSSLIAGYAHAVSMLVMGLVHNIRVC